jgi:hypothetical protein
VKQRQGAGEPAPTRRYVFALSVSYATALRTIRAALDDEGCVMVQARGSWAVVENGEMVVRVPEHLISPKA